MRLTPGRFELAKLSAISFEEKGPGFVVGGGNKVYVSAGEVDGLELCRPEGETWCSRRWRPIQRAIQGNEGNCRRSPSRIGSSASMPSAWTAPPHILLIVSLLES